MEIQQALAAIAEPTRFRIVLLLAESPRTVGEVAAALNALQPQTTKHLQALEAAGVIRVHRLGRRRVAAVDREAMRSLAGWFDALARVQDDDRMLDGYSTATEAVQARIAAGRDDGAEHVAIERVLAAPPAIVWRAWTDPDIAARWWAPRHFTVVRCEMAPEPGARVSLVLREGDGAEYASRGEVEDVVAESLLVYDLSPVDADGRTYFRVRHELTLEHAGGGTRVRLALDASGAGAGAASMLAGLRPGWSQLLDGLAALLADEGTRRSLGWEA